MIDFYLLFLRAQQRLFAVLNVLISMFKASDQLRLENLAVRQHCLASFSSQTAEATRAN
jgi:hypothetical protein